LWQEKKLMKALYRNGSLKQYLDRKVGLATLRQADLPKKGTIPDQAEEIAKRDLISLPNSPNQQRENQDSPPEKLEQQILNWASGEFQDNEIAKTAFEPHVISLEST
jgi:hypothetical protein